MGILFAFHTEYDKLWAAVTGGRGTGRGKRKKIIKGVDPEVLTFGKATLYDLVFSNKQFHSLCVRHIYNNFIE